MRQSPNYNLPVTELACSNFTENRLAENNIKTLYELVQYTPAQLLRLPMLGRKTLKEIQAALAAKDLVLGKLPWEP